MKGEKEKKTTQEARVGENRHALSHRIFYFFLSLHTLSRALLCVRVSVCVCESFENQTTIHKRNLEV